MEKILLKVRVKDIYFQGKGLPISADLYVTNNRMIFINLGNPTIAFALGGGIGYIFSKIRHSHKKKDLSLVELNKLIKVDKRSFDVKYSNIEKLKLGRVLLMQMLQMTINDKSVAGTLKKKQAIELKKTLNELVPNLLNVK